MAIPSQKSEALENFIDSITPNKLGRRRSIEGNKCTWCGGGASEFRNEISRREYNISGFCQKCQDKTFGED